MDSKIHKEVRSQKRIAAVRRNDERGPKHLSHTSERRHRVDPKPVLTQPTLTRREREVLVGMACGAHDEEIAKKLDMSLAEVKVHIEIIYKKLNAPNRLQAVLWAAEYL